MATTVVTTDEFAAWYRSLPEEQAEAVDFEVALLEERGVGLQPPHSAGLPGARHGIRELRVQSRRFPIRMYYAFNPIRQAVLLVGGNKKGEHAESKWTAAMLAKAEVLMDTYLAERLYEADRREEVARQATETKGRKR